jgi:hypothetical protein
VLDGGQAISHEEAAQRYSRTKRNEQRDSLPLGRERRNASYIH